jgi:hypothetical protein
MQNPPENPAPVDMTAPADTLILASAEDPDPEPVELVLLKRPSGDGIEVFNQGRYSDVLLPIPERDGDERNLRSSGCALCALCSYLHATGCRIDGQSLDPRSLTEWLKDYCEGRWSSSAADPYERAVDVYKVFNEDPSGALRFDENLEAAVNALVAETLGGTPGFSTSREDLDLEPGDANAALTAWIDAGKPVLISVNKIVNGEDEGSSSHVVLVVGYGRVGDETYYILNDSGYPPQDGYGILEDPEITRERLRYFSLSRDREVRTRSNGDVVTGYHVAPRMRVFQGLESYTELRPWSPPA